MIILTGGPGTGKTSLANFARQQSWKVYAESGRAILQEGFEFDPDNAVGFARKCTERDIANWEDANSLIDEDVLAGDRILFDRGMLDNIGYLKFMGLNIPPDIDQKCKDHRYRATIAALPPWKEIYAKDEERQWDWDQAQATGDAVISVWKSYGYEVVEMPLASIEERFDFLTQLANT